MHELTKAAINAVGPELPRDWELRPKTHADSLKDSNAASPLIRLLQDPALTEVTDTYEAADRDAMAAQGWYKGFAHVSAMTSLLAVVVASVNRFANTGNRLHTVPGVQPRRVDHVTVPRPIG